MSTLGLTVICAKDGSALAAPMPPVTPKGVALASRAHARRDRPAPGMV